MLLLSVCRNIFRQTLSNEKGTEYGEAVKENEVAGIAEEIKTTLRNKLAFTPIIKMIPPGTLEKSQYKIEYFERVYEKI